MRVGVRMAFEMSDERFWSWVARFGGGFSRERMRNVGKWKEAVYVLYQIVHVR